MAVLGVAGEFERLCALPFEEGEFDVVGEEEEGVGVGHFGGGGYLDLGWGERKWKQRNAKEMVDRLSTSSSSSSLSKGAFRGRDWDQSTGSCGSSDE